MTGAQFEIRIDGTPRSYRDRKDYAMEAARFIKSKSPNRRPTFPCPRPRTESAVAAVLADAAQGLSLAQTALQQGPLTPVPHDRRRCREQAGAPAQPVGAAAPLRSEFPMSPITL